MKSINVKTEKKNIFTKLFLTNDTPFCNNLHIFIFQVNKWKTATTFFCKIFPQLVSQFRSQGNLPFNLFLTRLTDVPRRQFVTIDNRFWMSPIDLYICCCCCFIVARHTGSWHVLSCCWYGNRQGRFLVKENNLLLFIILFNKTLIIHP